MKTYRIYNPKTEITAETKKGKQFQVKFEEIKPEDVNTNKTSYGSIRVLVKINNEWIKTTAEYARTKAGKHSAIVANKSILNALNVKVNKRMHIMLDKDWVDAFFAENQAALEHYKNEAQKLDIPSTLKLKHHSYHGWNVENFDYIVNYHPVLGNLHEIDHHAFKPVATDWDDYNITTYYEIDYATIEHKIRKALNKKHDEQIEANQRKIEKQKAEKARKEKLYKNVQKVEKSQVKIDKTDEDGDHEQTVTVTMISGKSYKFFVRNIFDFGKVINPAYIQGGGVDIDLHKDKMFDDEKKRQKYLSQSPSGMIWLRHEKKPVMISQEEAEAIKVADEATKNLNGIRL
jgi:hypothetical protein